MSLVGSQMLMQADTGASTLNVQDRNVLPVQSPPFAYHSHNIVSNIVVDSHIYLIAQFALTLRSPHPPLGVPGGYKLTLAQDGVPDAILRAPCHPTTCQVLQL